MIRLWTCLAAVLVLAASISLASVALAQGVERAPRGAATGVLSPPAALPGAPWSAEVAVADGGPDERVEAQAIALRAVLLANSGDKTLLNRDEVRAALDDAERYVERYDYRTPPPGTLLARDTPLTDTVRRTGEATRLLLVRFDPASLRNLIAPPRTGAANSAGAQGSAGDGADRGALASAALADPDTALVWLLIELEDERREIMLGDPAARNVRARAREIAGARGVTLVYPNGDAEDAAAFGADDIRQARLERLRPASARYAVPVVLNGHLVRDGLDAWEGRWTRLALDAPPDTPGESVSFTTGSLDEALQRGLGWLTSATEGDALYRYGGAATSSTEALVWVGPLDSVGAYATVMDFLQSVPGVGTVYPKESDARGTAFTVVPRGALPAVASAAAARDWLRRTTPPLSSGGIVGGGDARASSSDPRFERAGNGSARSLSDDRAAIHRPLAPNAELAFEYLR